MLYTAALTTALLLGILSSASAQHILFVNDNNNIFYNTDTVRNDMDHSIYSGYQYWSIPDSLGAYPSDSLMATFDLVVWYCSTDGVGLYLWSGSASGAPTLTTYASSGKPVWIIGIDILYQLYNDSAHFAPGNFAYDYMGLESYNGQSYVDDGGLGLPQADRVSTASTLFPDSLLWEFSTLWYADEVTPRPGVKSIYEMGPSSYVLSGATCMVHNHQLGLNVMSTFFDPALVDSFNHRVAFLQNGITYLLGSTTGVKNEPNATTTFSVYPNPTNKKCQIAVHTECAMTISYDVTDITGKKMLEQTRNLNNGNTTIDLPTEGWSAATYFVTVRDQAGKAIYTNRITKE